MDVGELVLRFVLGGLVVSLFAAIGEVFEPKTFAGLFGAAPSVAIASLSLSVAADGADAAAVASRWMLVGCAAMFAYAAAVAAACRRRDLPFVLGAFGPWLVWGAVAMVGWAALR